MGLMDSLSWIEDGRKQNEEILETVMYYAYFYYVYMSSGRMRRTEG